VCLDILMCSYNELSIAHWIKRTDARISTKIISLLCLKCVQFFFLTNISDCYMCNTFFF